MKMIATFLLVALASSTSALVPPHAAQIAKQLQTQLRKIEGLAVEIEDHIERTVRLEQDVSACTTAAQAMRTAGVGSLTIACSGIPLSIADHLMDLEAPASALNETCASMNNGCNEAINAHLKLMADTIDACGPLFDSEDTQIRTLSPSEEVNEFIKIQMLAQMLCLQVNDNLCLVTMRDAMKELNATTFNECQNQGVFNQEGQSPGEEFCGDAVGNSTSSPCNGLIENLFDDAGCCFTGYLAILRASVALAQPSAGLFRFPKSVCGNEIAFCPEVANFAMDSLGADNILIEDPTVTAGVSPTPGVGAGSATHTATTSLAAVAAGSILTLASQL